MRGVNFAMGAALGIMMVPSAYSLGLKPGPQHTTNHVPGELIVTVKSGASLLSLQTKMQDFKVRQVISLKAPGVYKIVGDEADLKNVQQGLKGLSEVSAVSPNYYYYAFDTDEVSSYTPRDQHFVRQWGLINIGQKLDNKYPMTPGSDMKMFKAWDAFPQIKTAARDVIVAVIDTGINLKHQDLKENLWVNLGESGTWTPASDTEKAAAPECRNKSCNKIDDDGNGYIDDVNGWNWSLNKEQKPVNTNDPQDDNGHGSHVSGVIGASHNQKGIAGINGKVQLMGLKFLGKKGDGTLEGAVEAIVYAAKMGADVINASWGGNESADVLFEAIRYATEEGVFFSAAAGNAALNNDYFASYPANYDLPGVVSVAATDFNDQRAFFSNYGKTRVHLAAPGHVIYSTVLGKKKYQYMSGTSMASPHVAGLAALMVGLNPEQFKNNPAALKKYLIETSDRSIELNWLVNSGGRINAYNAVAGLVPAGNRIPRERGTWTMQDYHVESDHPYVNSTQQEYVLSAPGAKWVRVHFGRHHLENGSDHVALYDKDGNLFDTLTGFGTEAVSRAVQGDTVRAVLKTDSSVNEWGFEIKSIEILE
ncbi:MAG: S8 family serine peptidase [Bdellovibrio sp.]|nr:S8 family serine peptidase [Bdellovibrio sp.]